MTTEHPAGLPVWRRIGARSSTTARRTLPLSVESRRMVRATLPREADLASRSDAASGNGVLPSIAEAANPFRRPNEPQAVMPGGHSHALQDAAFILAACALVLLAAFMIAYRLDTVADVFVDELLYVEVSSNLAEHGNLSARGEPFFMHPPLFFVVEALYLKLTASNPDDAFAAVYHARYLNAAIHAMTVAVILAFVTGLYGRRVGLTAAFLFIADSFVNRINQRNMLETLTMLLLLATLLALSEDMKRNRRSTFLMAGIALGLAVLTKEFVLPLMLVIMGVLAYRCQEAKTSRLLGVVAVGLLIYSAYPLWLWLSGDLGPFINDKTFQLERFSGFLQDTGWNREGASFYGALANRAQTYGASYAMIGLAFPLTLLLWRRPGFPDRFVASWALATYLFFVYVVVRGLNNDQFFYYLIIPPFVVVARWLWIGLAGVRKWELIGSPRRILGVGLALALLGATAFNSFRWVEEHRSPDNGYERLTQFVIAHIPLTEEINVTTEPPNRFLPQYNLTSWDEIEELERERPRYFIVSTLDARDHRGTTTEEYYQWVASNSREIFYFEGRSFQRLSVFELEERPAGEAAEPVPPKWHLERESWGW